jgi:S-adenosylmethionine:tRNA ribosyltransferase-isomerase
MVASFELPAELEASEPHEPRDDVRLLVASRRVVRHARFADLAQFLQPGDLLVVNTSGTLPAAVDGTHRDGSTVTVHFSTAITRDTWIVEVRPSGPASGPAAGTRGGDRIALPDGIGLTLLNHEPEGQTRLWRANVAVEGGVEAYLARHGRPIRYAYVPRPIPLADYRTVFAREDGSAEMPSAARPFTADVVVDLVTRGVAIAPVTLHTGVSSQEPGEPPQRERFTVPETTARMVTTTRACGNRVVAVGTTVTRALETVADEAGTLRGRSGWTELVLGPDRPARVVNGLITGWHAPGASHLALLESVAGRDLVDAAYAEALAHRYLWHEFGDSCLLLP